MLMINVPQRKKIKRTYESKYNNENHSAVYNTKTWKDLRFLYLTNNPLCEECKKKKIITLANDVHHKIPISEGMTKAQKKVIGYDYNNLKALCKDCHKNEHH